jgi:hypothetical protein
MEPNYERAGAIAVDRHRLPQRRNLVRREGGDVALVRDVCRVAEVQSAATTEAVGKECGVSQHLFGPVCISLHGWREGGWIRWFNRSAPCASNGRWGIHLRGPASEPLFSEREGHNRPFLRWRGWRLFFIRPNGRAR